MNRRHFLEAAGATAVATSLAQAGGEPPLASIDTHTHFYDPTRPQGVPWPPRNDEILYRPVLPPEFRRLTERLGVQSTIVVEASAWVEDNQWLLDLAANERIITGIVGNLDPANAEFGQQLQRFSRNRLYRGIRVGHANLRANLDNRRYLDHLQQLQRGDRSLDVLGGPEQLPDIARLARELPELRIIINHVANVAIDGEAPPADWVRGMRAAAEHPQVYCKVSGLVESRRRRNRDASLDGAVFRPVLDVLWDSFGADRLLYGSNWPVSERFAPYASVHEIASRYFLAKGPAEAEKVFQRNARAVYKPVERREE